MPTIEVDGIKIEAKDGQTVLQAVLQANVPQLHIPHYCYHPALSIAGSCRMCLVEVGQVRNGQVQMGPKLVPSCQTPVAEGMVVRTNTEKVIAHQQMMMELLLLNHPLDCPVCDQAGECFLQDYSFLYGRAESRFIDAKIKQPKKDIGPHLLLYADRCILCSRCVRFCREITGTGELYVHGRGNRSEIDVFSGYTVANKLSGNLVDICPVGAILEKDFLFAQRVWLLQSAASICPLCSRGCNIRIDYRDDRVYRVKPRYNARINEFWICDDGRYGWKFIHRRDRLTDPLIRADGRQRQISWPAILQAVREKLSALAGEGAGIAAVLSPAASCEENHLLIQFIRKLAPEAVLVCGPVPSRGSEERFKCGFTIKPEKVPNRRGVEMLIADAGGRSLSIRQFAAACRDGKIRAAYVLGGYNDNCWQNEELLDAMEKLSLLIVQDILPSRLSELADIVLPAAAWAETDGSFVNCDGIAQAFNAAIAPPQQAKRGGDIFYQLLERDELFSADDVRRQISEKHAEFAELRAVLAVSPAKRWASRFGLSVSMDATADLPAPSPGNRQGD